MVLGYFMKAQTGFGLRFVPFPGPRSSGDQVLGECSRLQLKAVSYHLPRPSCSCISSGELISGYDCPNGCRQSRIPRSLVSNEVCLQFGIGCFSGATIAPFQLWLPSPTCLQQKISWSAASYLCLVLCSVNGPSSVLG